MEIRWYGSSSSSSGNGRDGGGGGGGGAALTALRPLVVFILVMWALMIAGGGILVLVVAPIEVDCCGGQGPLLSSILKAGITLGLVVLWILVLSWMKRLLLHRMLY